MLMIVALIVTFGVPIGALVVANISMAVEEWEIRKEEN